MKGKILVGALAFVLLTGLVSAALVDYLSNTVEADVTVSSPIEHRISDDGNTFGAGTITMTAFGGESKDVWFKTKNLADADIYGYPETTVSNTAGITCDDVSIVVDISSNTSTALLLYNQVVSCDNNTGDPNSVVFVGVPYLWSSYETVSTNATLTFDQYASGTYTLSSQIV